MIVSFTSIDEVIGRIVRNTRVQDSSYLIDAGTWIPEAMAYMRTKVELQTTYEDLSVDFHKAKSPTHLVYIKAIEYGGHRLEYGNDVRAIETVHKRHDRGSGEVGKTTGFITVPLEIINPEEGTVRYDSTVLPVCSSTNVEGCNALPSCNHWYNTELGYINTSFPDGTIRVHYTRMALDENGFPIIPDQENYIQACYYYCRAMMIGAGWQDPVFKHNELMAHFEREAGRAIGKIRYPSTDQMEMKVNNHRRLVMDNDYFKKFFSTPHPEQQYGDMRGAVSAWRGISH